MNILKKIKATSFPIKLLITFVLLDQITKLMALNILKMNTNNPINRWLEIFPTLNFTSNSLLESYLVVGFSGLAIIYVLLITAIIFLWRKSMAMGCTNKLFYIGLAGLLSGAISNGIDRLYLPGSIDWILLMISDDIALGLNLTDFAMAFGLISLLVSVGQQIHQEINQGKIKLA